MAAAVTDNPSQLSDSGRCRSAESSLSTHVAVARENEYGYEWVAANHNSQRVAHSSTARNADELNCRVRDGYGWNLVALAAETDQRSRTVVLQIGAYHRTIQSL